MTDVPEGKKSTLHAVILCLGASSLYALMSALIKHASSGADVAAVIASRYGFSCLALIPLYFASNRPSIRTSKPITHLTRGLLSFAIFVMYTMALERIPLQNAIVLNSSYVLFLPLLSLILVGSRISVAVAFGLVFGFAGIVVISGVSVGGPLDSGSLLALGSALATAAATVMVAKLGKTESSFSIVFYFFFISFICSLIFMTLTGSSFSTEDYWLMASIGILGVSYQYFFTAALKYISSELACSVMNTSILFGFMLSFFMFSDIPDRYDVIGSLMILAGILIVTWHSSKSMRKPEHEIQQPR